MKFRDRVKHIFNAMTGKLYFDIGYQGSAEQVAQIFQKVMNTELSMPDPHQHFGGLTARLAAYERWEKTCSKARRAAQHCTPGLHLALREGRPENLKTACKHAREEDLAMLLHGLSLEERIVARSAMTPAEMSQTYEQLWLDKQTDEDGLLHKDSYRMAIARYTSRR